VAAAAAFAVALSIIGGHDIRRAIDIGMWVDRTLGFALPIAAFAMGVRAKPQTLLRTTAFVTGGAWVAALAARAPYVAAMDSFAIAVGVSLARVVAVAGLALLPVVAVSRRVVPRWPLLSTIALAAGDATQKTEIATYHVVRPQFDPSPMTMAIFVLLAYAFLVAARELRHESIDEYAERFSPMPSKLFATEAARGAFLGPVRLATDAVLAFAVTMLVATTTTVAYSRTFRLDAPPAGAESAALVVVLTAALLWIKRSYDGISLAPVVAGVIAVIATVFSALFVNAAALSMALLPLGVAVFGLAIVAPRTRDAEARTMRRWGTFVAATGVALASAGFFAIYSLGQGEPFLARVAKLASVVFGILAANASARLELHSRIELAAEEQRP
jgi:hypothetical protein